MTKYFIYTKNEFLEKTAEQLSPKAFYESYLALYWFCLVLAFIAQVLSFGSEYIYFQGLFSSTFNSFLLIGVTALFCLLLETAKFFLAGAFFKQLFLLKKSSFNPFLLVLALVISAVSIYASVVGGGKFGIDTAKVINVESKHDKEISVLRNEIDAIHKRNSWKGNVYIAGKDKELLHKKEEELSKLKKAKEKDLQVVAQENANKEVAYRYGFASFELIFIIATLFVYYFKRRSYIENLASDDNGENHLPAKVGISTIPNSTLAPNSISKIGFQIPTTLKVNNGEGNTVKVEREYVQLNVNKRVCKHCGKVFTFKHWNATYCGEKCKIEAWELRTGKKFYKKGKGGKT